MRLRKRACYHKHAAVAAAAPQPTLFQSFMLRGGRRRLTHPWQSSNLHRRPYWRRREGARDSRVVSGEHRAHFTRPGRRKLDICDSSDARNDSLLPFISITCISAATVRCIKRACNGPSVLGPSPDVCRSSSSGDLIESAALSEAAAGPHNDDHEDNKEHQTNNASNDDPS